MFGIDKEELAINLEKIRLQRCAYGGVSYCDCKYGHPDGEPNHMSETFSGCPEISMATQMIEFMTQKEFERICKRAKIIIT